MDSSFVLVLGVILVFSNVVGISILSVYMAHRARRVWLMPTITFVALGTLYCITALRTPLDGLLQVMFLERLPFEVGMLLGLGLLWLQWILQVGAYWRRRRHSPLIFLILNYLTTALWGNLAGIALIFVFQPTMTLIRTGWSNDPTTYNSEWVFELGWLTYFTLGFVVPLLLLSLKSAPKFWQLRHWLTGLGTVTLMAWSLYWLNCADIGPFLPSAISLNRVGQL